MTPAPTSPGTGSQARTVARTTTTALATTVGPVLAIDQLPIRRCHCRRPAWPPYWRLRCTNPPQITGKKNRRLRQRWRTRWARRAASTVAVVTCPELKGFLLRFRPRLQLCLKAIGLGGGARGARGGHRGTEAAAASSSRHSLAAPHPSKYWPRANSKESACPEDPGCQAMAKPP